MTNFVIQLQHRIQQFLDELDCGHLSFSVNKTKNIEFGDFSTNVLLVLAQHFKTRQKPFVLSEMQNKLFQCLDMAEIASMDYVAPGFVNFVLKPQVLNHLSAAVVARGVDFGKQPTQDFCYYLELVSANPTGLLHIGHARNGVFGDSLANLLELGGYTVYREYYINNVGSQITNLAYAVFVRYANLCGNPLPLPQDSYHGAEIILCAQKFYDQYQQQYANVLVAADRFVNHKDQALFANFATEFFLSEIKRDLATYQIKIDGWFAERTLHQKGWLVYTLNQIRYDLYYRDRALWFGAHQYGANKDEVVIKSDQVSPTYYAHDICYHFQKLHKFDLAKTQLINIFGADHHGHVPRLRAFVQAIDFDPNKITFLITQLIRLMRDQKEVKMSKRTGNSLTMRQMYEMVGYNALRWYLVSQSINTHIDIDLDQIAQQDATNPIYYVLYAYARIWQILNKFSHFQKPVIDFQNLTHTLERKIVNHLLMFEPSLISAITTFEVHRVCNYLYELAQLLHSYYAAVNISQTQDLVLQYERLSLIYLVQQIIFNGLAILKITPQKTM